MELKLSKVIWFLACLLVPTLAQSSVAQEAGVRRAPQFVYTTPYKTIVADLKLGESDVHEVRIKVTFTITAANYDDTMVGTLVFTIPEDVRKRIAEVSCEPLSSIPFSIKRNNVVAGFRKGTSCPIVNIETGATELDVAGAKLSFKRITVDMIETPQEVQQHFCLWTRQINAKRPHRGVIASLNRLITVEP